MSPPFLSVHSAVAISKCNQQQSAFVFRNGESRENNHRQQHRQQRRLPLSSCITTTSTSSNMYTRNSHRPHARATTTINFAMASSLSSSFDVAVVSSSSSSSAEFVSLAQTALMAGTYTVPLNYHHNIQSGLRQDHGCIVYISHRFVYVFHHHYHQYFTVHYRTFICLQILLLHQHQQPPYSNQCSMSQP